MTLSNRDRKVLRDLASQVADVAADPVMAERRARWRRHNALDAGAGPMILVFPEGSWRELLPRDGMLCDTEETRAMEWTLRSRLYHHAHLHDDTVIEAEWIVTAAVTDSGWGLSPKQVASTAEHGAWGFDPVIRVEADLDGLRTPEVMHDEAETQRRFDLARDLFEGLLDVRLKGVPRISFHLMATYSKLRGLEQVFLDMVENPAMLHRAIAFLAEGERRRLDQYEALNLLSLNNDSTYHSSGGNGYIDDLPAPGFDPQRVRLADMWGSAEAQELDRVSPAMHEEFSLQYERPLLAPFGLTGYGCCDDLTRKLDYVRQLPNMRRISIAPWADVTAAAEGLGGDYIFSWKPQPTWLVGDFDEEGLRRYLRQTLDVAQGCVLEMILKDTHTCEGRPERFDRWTRIARQVVEEAAGRSG